MSTEMSCHFIHLLEVSKKISGKSDFIHFFFHDFIHVYSPKAGAVNPLGMEFLCQQEHLVTSFICCKFQKKSLGSLMTLYMYIAPRKVLSKLLRDKIFIPHRNILSLWSSVASLKKSL